MKRQVREISDTAHDSEVPHSISLVRLDGTQHRWQAQKHFYPLRLSILKRTPFTGRSIVSRLYCTPKAVWKLGCLLRNFLFDDPNCGAMTRSTSARCAFWSEW